MESVHRNVILDLLPAYIAGEVSDETRVLVEEFARGDVQITRLIRAGAHYPSATTARVSLPESLEVKAMKRIRQSIRRQMVYVAMATVALLMVPFTAMQFTSEVNWSPFDFIVMGALLFGTGLMYVLVSRMSENFAYRAAVGLGVLTSFLLVWVNLAVGFIGSEDNPANALYLGVLLTGLVGAGIARFRAKGMARSLFAMAIVQLLVPLVAMMIWRPSMDDAPGILGVFVLNGVFAGLFVLSGLLFVRAGKAETA